MAAKKITTISALLVALSIQLSAEDKPKQSKFHAVTHWVATHKKLIVISAGTAAATGFALHNSYRPRPAPVSPSNFTHICVSGEYCGNHPAPPGQ